MINRYTLERGVFVPAGVARVLWRALKLDAVRADHRGEIPELDAVLSAWAEVAALEQLEIAASVSGSRLGDPVPSVSPSEWMTTNEVATASGLTARAVRAAATEHRLAGRQCGHAWSFRADDVAEWIEARNAAQ